MLDIMPQLATSAWKTAFGFYSLYRENVYVILASRVEYSMFPEGSVKGLFLSHDDSDREYVVYMTDRAGLGRSIFDKRSREDMYHYFTKFAYSGAAEEDFWVVAPSLRTPTLDDVADAARALTRIHRTREAWDLFFEHWDSAPRRLR